MKLLLPIYIAILFLLAACSTNQADTTVPENEDIDKETSINHVHGEDDKEVENHFATEDTDETYTFQSDRYKYKDGHIILTWEELARVTFEEDYDKTVEEYIFRPVFSDTLKALDGKKIMIEGYVIPFEETGDETFIVLSGLPYLQCFFCGEAGPETVIDILPKGKLKKRLKTDQKTTFKGKLRLNSEDLDYLNYILDDAEIVK